MSLTSIARQSTTQIQNIPTRRMLITDSNQIPNDYSSTPNGTIYSTTPGGSRIVYDRSFLMTLKNSPLSQTPPRNGVIPDCLLRGGSGCSAATRSQCSPSRNISTVEEEQFVLEI